MRTLLASILVLAACSHPHDVNATYTVAPPGGAGAVDVVLNGATSALSVTVNDTLVIDRKYSRHAHVDGIPAGLARVHVATGGGCEQAREYDRDVDVMPGMVATVALPGSEPNIGCAILNGATSVFVGLEVVGLAILATGAAVAGGHAAMSHVK